MTSLSFTLADRVLRVRKADRVQALARQIHEVLGNYDDAYYVRATTEHAASLLGLDVDAVNDAVAALAEPA
jgi:hypothetical protein